MIKTDTREKLTKLGEICDFASSDLGSLKGQLAKIIEIKKKSQKDLSGSMMMHSAGNVLKHLENLEKIFKQLMDSIGKVADLRDKIELSLRSEYKMKSNKYGK